MQQDYFFFSDTLGIYPVSMAFTIDIGGIPRVLCNTGMLPNTLEIPPTQGCYFQVFTQK